VVQPGADEARGDAGSPPDDDGEGVSTSADGDTRARWQVLRELDDWLETPMLVLSLVWLVLVIYELAAGSSRLMEIFGTAIWGVFLVEFLLRLALAPEKFRFLRTHWLTVVALAVPALRMVRILRAFRAVRGLTALRSLRLVRIVTTANRGMRALRGAMRRRRLGYLVVLTAAVALLGAGGMYAFEPASEVDGGFRSYGDAVWWTGMLLTTMGSAFWPVTTEGRILCFLLSLYGFGVFGYLTASFASYFVGRDAEPGRGAAGVSEGQHHR
jgi:voltage-gated potassium channel